MKVSKEMCIKESVVPCKTCGFKRGSKECKLATNSPEWHKSARWCGKRKPAPEVYDTATGKEVFLK